MEHERWDTKTKENTYEFQKMSKFPGRQSEIYIYTMSHNFEFNLLDKRRMKNQQKSQRATDQCSNKKI